MTGWNYPIKTISTDNVLKWWNRAKTGCKFLQKTILLKIKYLSVLFTYYKSEYFCIFCKWLIFNAVCIFFWKMEGRVCLRVRIPYALSTLKNGNRFFLWLVLGLLTAFWSERRYNYCFWLEEGCAGLFWARSGCFSIKNEYEKTENGHGWWKKVLLLRCPSQREGVSGRGWAGFRSAPCVFFVFGCIKNRKSRFWFPGPGLIFGKRFFGKDAENHVFATIAANFIDFCS